MAERTAQSAGAVRAHRLPRSWRSVVFASVGDGQRRRRGSDGVRLAAAAIALGGCLLLIRFDSRMDRAIIAVIHPPPRSIDWLVTVVYQAGWLGVALVLVACALAARRWEVARDIALSAAGAAAVTGLLIGFLGSRGGRPAGIVPPGYDPSFPVLRIALFAAVATAALPYLARDVQRCVEVVIALVALACAVGGHGPPLNVGGSLAIGWGVTAVVRLVVGSPLGLPSAEDVRRLLAELGIGTSQVRPAARQVWGVAKYEAIENDPTGNDPTGNDPTGNRDAGAPARLGIAVYGRDAADARLLTKVGRFVVYRDSGPSLTITRLQQVEHEAYLTLRAGQAGAAVPEIVEAGTAGPAKDALLVTRLPPGTALADTDAAQVSDAMLDDVYRQLLILRGARIAHGAISGDALRADPATQTIVLADFRNASVIAAPDRLDRDIAGALAATAVTAGPERAAAAAARCLPPRVLQAALRQLQRPVLDPALNRSLHGQRKLLADVRQRTAEAASVEAPKLAEPHRVSWPTLIMMVGLMIGGWALIDVLLNVSRSFGTVIGADWLWVIVAFVLAQLSFLTGGLQNVGSVAGPLPFGRAVAIEVANSFTALAGGTPAVLAARVRFFQKQGSDAAVAISSAAIITTASWISIVVLFACSLPFAGPALNLVATPQGGVDPKLVWIALAVLVAVSVLTGLAIAVPRLRRFAAEQVRPRVRQVWANLKQVAVSPHKLLLLAGGSFARQLLVAMCLSVSLRAFGDHLSLPVLIVIITLAGFVGGISPSPGGMGVVEAGMILGLTAAGVSEANATAAVFIQRLFTSYLPPIWGWVVLVWMRRKEYL